MSRKSLPTLLAAILVVFGTRASADPVLTPPTSSQEAFDWLCKEELGKSELMQNVDLCVEKNLPVQRAVEAACFGAAFGVDLIKVGYKEANAKKCAGGFEKSSTVFEKCINDLLKIVNEVSGTAEYEEFWKSESIFPCAVEMTTKKSE